MIVAFIDELRHERIVVELTCAVLGEQGCEVTARTYRVWRQPNRPLAARVVTDAQVIDAVLGVVYDDKDQLTPEGLYGRRKMTAPLSVLALATMVAVVALGVLQGVVVAVLLAAGQKLTPGRTPARRSTGRHQL